MSRSRSQTSLLRWVLLGLLGADGPGASQHLSLRTTNAIERMQQEFRRRVKTQAALPSEDAVLRLFFGLWVSGQITLHRIRGYRDLGGQKEAAA